MDHAFIYAWSNDNCLFTFSKIYVECTFKINIVCSVLWLNYVNRMLLFFFFFPVASAEGTARCTDAVVDQSATGCTASRQREHCNQHSGILHEPILEGCETLSCEGWQKVRSMVVLWLTKVKKCGFVFLVISNLCMPFQNLFILILSSHKIYLWGPCLNLI